MGLKDNIAFLCNKQNKTIAQIELEAGIAPRTITRWNDKAPSIDKVLRVAKVLNTTAEFLYLGEEPVSPAITESFVAFPIVGEVAAGYEHIAYESWDNGNIDIPESWLHGRSKDDYFVLKVCGNSMFPDYQDGDVVLVLRQNTADYSGQVVVALYDDEIGTLKRIEYDPQQTWIRLSPINPQYPPLMIEGEDVRHCQVLGIPKKLIRNISK